MVLTLKWGSLSSTKPGLQSHKAFNTTVSRTTSTRTHNDKHNWREFILWRQSSYDSLNLLSECITQVSFFSGSCNTKLIVPKVRIPLHQQKPGVLFSTEGVARACFKHGSKYTAASVQIKRTILA